MLSRRSQFGIYRRGIVVQEVLFGGELEGLIGKIARVTGAKVAQNAIDKGLEILRKEDNSKVVAA